jgi:chromosome segregation ATPase
MSNSPPKKRKFDPKESVQQVNETLDEKTKIIEELRKENKTLKEQLELANENKDDSVKRLETELHEANILKMAKNSLYEKYYTISQEFKDKNKELSNDNNKLYDLAMLKKAMYERLKQDFFKITSAQSTTIEEYKAKENELNDDIARLRGTIAGKDSTILQNKHTITTLTNDNTNQANHI